MAFTRFKHTQSTSSSSLSMNWEEILTKYDKNGDGYIYWNDFQIVCHKNNIDCDISYGPITNESYNLIVISADVSHFEFCSNKPK